MLRRLLEVRAPGPVFDVCELDSEVVVAALGVDGVLWGDTLCPVEAEFLVPGPEGVLALSLQAAERRRTLTWMTEGSRVDQGAWLTETWIDSFSSSYWVTAEEGAVWVWELQDGRLQPVANEEMPRPAALYWQRWARGVGLLVEMADSVALHTMPRLMVVDQRPLPPAPVQYPAEVAVHASHGVYATMPLANPEARPRLVNSTGRELAVLPAAAQGLVADPLGRALVWVRVAKGVEFILVAGGPDRVLERFLIPDATHACARLQGSRLLVGDDLGRVLVFEC